MHLTFLKKTSVIYSAVFFITFYFYVLFRINPQIIYHGNGVAAFPVFFKGMIFFKNFINYPGGLIDYISAFLSQLYYFPSVGAFIITTITLVICLLTNSLIKSFGGISSRLLFLLSAIFVLIAFNQYLNYLSIILKLLISLLFFRFYLFVSHSKIIYRIIFYFIITSFLYYTAGSSGFFLALLCGLYEVFILRKHIIGLLYIITSITSLYYLDLSILNVMVFDSYQRIIPYYFLNILAPAAAAWGPLVFLLLLALFVSIFNVYRNKKAAVNSESEKTRKKNSISKSKNKERLRFLYEALLISFLFAGAALFTFNKLENTMLKMNYYSNEEKWDNILEEVEHIPYEYNDLLLKHNVNRALFFKNRLLESMFSYPQDVESLLTLNFYSQDPTMYVPELTIVADTFFKIGIINYAEHSLHEALEVVGEYPKIVHQLFLINFVKGKYNAANIFLNLLSKDLINGNKAKEYKNQLEKGSFGQGNKIIQNIQSIKLEEDYDSTLNIETVLKNLIEKSNNRMAFEYLMAYYLYTAQFDKIAQNIKLFNFYNYPNLPRHIEEALIIHMNITGKRIDLNGRKISRETNQRFGLYAQIMNDYSEDAFKGLRQATMVLGDSYFPYHYNYLIREKIRKK
ncbi:DUF6057 family protein [candidate division KSB1 bacterium]